MEKGMAIGTVLAFYDGGHGTVTAGGDYPQERLKESAFGDILRYSSGGDYLRWLSV
jgi:hypothetical protein